MGDQGHAAIESEWLIVSSGAGAVYLYGYLRARSAGGSPTTLSLLRAISGTFFYVALSAGSALFLFGATAGLYIAAFAMLTLGVDSVSGAWLLLLGAHADERGRTGDSP